MQLQELARAETERRRAYELGVKLAGGAQLLLGHISYGERRLEDAQRAFEQYLKDVPSAPNASQIKKTDCRPQSYAQELTISRESLLPAQLPARSHPG